MIKKITLFRNFLGTGLENMLSMTVSTGSTHDNILHVKNDFKKNSRFDLCVMLLVINNAPDYG